MAFEWATALIALTARRPDTGRQQVAEPRPPAEVIQLPVRAPEPPPEPDKPPPAAPGKPLPSARRFIEWMQDWGFTGEFGWQVLPGATRNGRLWEFYTWHCADQNLTPIPENKLGEALGKLCKKRQIRDRSTGKLRRLTAYRIPEAKERKAA